MLIAKKYELNAKIVQCSVLENIFVSAVFNFFASDEQNLKA